jgi:conserved oligomeric Golgi complex subunit 3
MSLLNASTQISNRSSPTDAQLFLLTHFLTLKQQIVAFDIEFISPEVSFDFSNITSTFYELRARGGLFNPRNWGRLVLGGGLVPRVVENMLDAKAELDGRLRTVINDFTLGVAGRITAPVKSPAASKSGFDAGKAAQAVRANAEKDVPFLRKKLDEYVDDTRTKETLVAAVQDAVAQTYEEWYEAHMAKAGQNGKALAARKGKGREDGIWDPEMFEGWCEGVFKVGRIGLGLTLGDEADDDRESLGTVSRSGST